jgi:hypothetical protein
MDFIEALTKGSNNAIEISYVKQHGLLLLLEIASFLAKVHVDNNFYSRPVTKSIAAMTQARASFATGLLVADADYRNFHGFNPWLPIRAICM